MQLYFLLSLYNVEMFGHSCTSCVKTSALLMMLNFPWQQNVYFAKNFEPLQHLNRDSIWYESTSDQHPSKCFSLHWFMLHHKASMTSSCLPHIRHSFVFAEVCIVFNHIFIFFLYISAHIYNTFHSRWTVMRFTGSADIMGPFNVSAVGHCIRTKLWARTHMWISHITTNIRIGRHQLK